MRSLTDPVAVLQRRIRWTWSLGTAALLACAFWAATWRSAASALPTLRVERPETTTAENPQPRWDVSAFEAAIWHPPPEEAPATRSEDTAVRSTTSRLTLIAITIEEGKLLAAIYDPEQDELTYVGVGDRIGQLTATSVEAGQVELTDGRSRRSLRLEVGP